MRSSELRRHSVRHGRTALLIAAILFSLTAGAQDLGVIGAKKSHEGLFASLFIPIKHGNSFGVTCNKILNSLFIWSIFYVM